MNENAGRPDGQGRARKPQPTRDRVSTRAKRLALPIWLARVRSPFMGGTFGNYGGSATITTKPMSRTWAATYARRMSCVTRKPAARSRSARARWRRGAATARRERRGARASSPLPRSLHQPPGWSADCGGSRSSLEALASRGCPSTRRKNRGTANVPRPELRAGKVVKSARSKDRRPQAGSQRRVQRCGLSTLPARSVGRRFWRHELRPVAKMPGKTSSFAQRAWWLAA